MAARALADLGVEPPIFIDRAPVLPSRKVWGDDEATAAGLYETKASVAPMITAQLPPGFKLDEPSAELPTGFKLDAEPVQAKPIAPGKPDIGQGRALYEGARAGLTANFGDELAGLSEASGLSKSVPEFVGPLPVRVLTGATRMAVDKLKGGGNAASDYERGRDEVRANQKTAEEQYPGTYLTGDVAGSLAGAVGPGSLIRGATLVPRFLKALAVGGALGGAAGAGAGETTEERVKGGAVGAGVGAAVGGVGETLITGIGKAIQRYLGAARQPAPGVSPSARMTEADEFGVPLTRGQSTGNVEQQAFEEAARNEARGRFAGQAVRGFDDRQARAIDAAKGDISTQLGGRASTKTEAGESVAVGLQNRAAELRQSADDAYQRAADKDAWIDASAIKVLGERVAKQLDDGGIRLDVYGNYPGSQAAMSLLRRVAGFEGAPAGKVAAQSLEGIEQARKGLLKVKPGNAEDARALRAIRNEFDIWIDDAVNARLFSGDRSAIDDLKEARSFWSQLKGITAPGKTDSSKIVSKIATEQRTGDEVANWLLGTAGAGQAGRSARVAASVKNHLGSSSPEWEALRQAAWSKMTEPARGTGSQAVSNSILSFTTKEGAPLARVLFTPQEIGLMNRFAKVLSHTVPDPKATNPSKSGYAVARLLGAGVFSGGSGAAYFWSGDPKFLAIASLPLIKGAAGLSKGVAATRALPSRPGSITADVSRVGYTAGALNQ